MRGGSPLLPCTLAALVLACGPNVMLADDSSGADTGASTGPGGGGVDSGSPATSAITNVTSDGDGVDDASDGADETGAPPPERCPEDQWPNDGSEVIEVVTESSVVDWFHADANPNYLSYLDDEQTPVPGQPTRALADKGDNASQYNFGATVGFLSAEPFLGRRVRMRSQVALLDVEYNAGLWLRVDHADGTTTNLDNGSDHPDYGTFDGWQEREIVLDVPDDADNLVFGQLLSAPGLILVSNPVFEIVTEDVPTTSPNRRRPPQALTCAAPTDDRVEEIVHFTRADMWSEQSDLPPVGYSAGRDASVLFDGVPTLHVGGAFSAELLVAFAWASQKAGHRLRLTVPIRAAGLTGDVRLVFKVLEGGFAGVETVRITDPLPITPDATWAYYSVVTEIPDDPRAWALAGIRVEGSGDVWVGYGVVEQVTDAVPLSPIEP